VFKDYSMQLLVESVSVVVPVYNSCATLRELYNRLCRVLDSEVRVFEVLFIDDGSRDGCWEVLADFSRMDPRIRSFRLMRNYGQHNAVLCGIREARYSTIVTIDDDLQQSPEDIPKLLALLSENDVVYGIFQEEKHGFFRRIASVLIKTLLQKTMGVSIAISMSSFRAFRTELRKSFVTYCGAMPIVDVLLSWGTSRFGSVPVSHHVRQEGSSGYDFYKLVVHAFNIITGFTTIPLRIGSCLGFVLTLCGLGLLFFIVGRFALYGTSVPGFPFLASIICIFSGAQFFVVGIMGEYLARMHQRLMDKPTYTVAETINSQLPPAKPRA